MEENLHQHVVVSQNEAVEAVAKAVRRARAGLQGSQAPDRVVHLLGAHRGGQDPPGASWREFMFGQKRP